MMTKERLIIIRLPHQGLRAKTNRVPSATRFGPSSAKLVSAEGVSVAWGGASGLHDQSAATAGSPLDEVTVPFTVGNRLAIR